MPTIAEKARAEAEAAEAADNDEQHDDEHELEHDREHVEHDAEPVADTEPHPADGLEEPSDQMIAELRAACDDHHDHVRSIMGPFVEAFEPCETCNGIGLAYPQPAGPALEPRQGAAECPVCKGYGELTLPTRREQFKIEQCVHCAGRGWVGEGNQPALQAAQQAVESFPQQADGQPPAPTSSQPPSTDPRVQQLRAEGFIVLEKPNA